MAHHGLTQSTEEAEAKARELAAYVRRLIDTKEAAPGDDMVSRVIEEHVKTGRLSRDDFAEIGAMILRAGHDTTTNMIGMGALLLLRDDALRARLAADPSLVEAAVEEFLRYVSPVQFSPRRVALEDVEIGGVTVAKGEGLFLSLPSANRDDALFADPDRIGPAAPVRIVALLRQCCRSGFKPLGRPPAIMPIMAISPPSQASGETWRATMPQVPPEKRPSVMRPTESPSL